MLGTKLKYVTNYPVMIMMAAHCRLLGLDQQKYLFRCFNSGTRLEIQAVNTHGSAKDTKIESSYLNEIPLQMSPKGMWGPENIKNKNFRWGLFEFYIFLY